MKFAHSKIELVLRMKSFKKGNAQPKHQRPTLMDVPWPDYRFLSRNSQFPLAHQRPRHCSSLRTGENMKAGSWVFSAFPRCESYSTHGPKKLSWWSNMDPWMVIQHDSTQPNSTNEPTQLTNGPMVNGDDNQGIPGSRFRPPISVDKAHFVDRRTTIWTLGARLPAEQCMAIGVSGGRLLIGERD